MEIENSECNLEKKIDCWFSEINKKIVILKTESRKKSAWKKHMNRKKKKFIFLRKRLKILSKRLESFKKKSSFFKEEKKVLEKKIEKIENELISIKRETKCLKLVKKKFFSSNFLKKNVENNLSLNRSENFIFDKWKKETNECLFGHRKYIFYNKNNRYKKTFDYYRSCSISFKNLIRIRHLWDKYLNQNGTSIPVTYVMPNFTPNQNWCEYLNKEKNSLN